MYFRASNNKNRYYGEDIEITEEVKSKIPKNIDIVFWHYGEEPFCDDYMLKKHTALERPVMFAGGNWGWSGCFPENNYMMKSNRFSLSACRKNGVEEAMFTIWGNDNAECSNFANLFGLSFFEAPHQFWDSSLWLYVKMRVKTVKIITLRNIALEILLLHRRVDLCRCNYSKSSRVFS